MTLHRRSNRSPWLPVAVAASGILLLIGSAPAQDAPAASAPERVSRLGGRAYLGRNAPVVGGTVLVRPEDRPGEFHLTSTDEDGEFRVDGLPDGSYSVRIEREGLEPEVKSGVPLKFPFRAVVELGMEPAAAAATERSVLTTGSAAASGPLSLAGRVIEAGDGPAGEVQLRFVRLDGGEDPRRLRSRPDGSFELDGVGAGVWRVEISGVGYLAQRMALDLRGAPRLHVSLVRQPADYDPTPLELMPPEQPIPPAGLAEGAAGVDDEAPDTEREKDGL